VPQLGDEVLFGVEEMLVFVLQLDDAEQLDVVGSSAVDCFYKNSSEMLRLDVDLLVGYIDYSQKVHRVL
jgi:hypothetical protein